MDLAGQTASGPSEGFSVEGEVFDPPGGAAPLFPGSSAVLVGPDVAGVDADRPLHVADRVVLDDHLVQDPFPGPVRCPDPQPLVRGLPGPVAFWKITPRGSGAQFPQDRVDHLSVITPPTTSTRDRWQQRLDSYPGLIGQFTTSHHPGMIIDRKPEPLQDTP